MPDNVTIRSCLRQFWPAALLGLAASLYGWAVFVSTFNHPGAIGFNYIAPGSDWMVLYGAIRLALTAHFALTLDSDGFTAYVNASFAHWLSQPMFYRPWVYPPSFLILLLPFGMLGFMASYALFQFAGGLLLAAALLTRPDQRPAAKWVALAALLCPAASISVVDGQCGFLITGLLVWGLRLLPGRPLLAGAVLGLLCVKPQFGLMVPVALLAVRQWRGMLGAAASSLSLAALSVVAFGWQPWLWWFNRAASSLGDTASKWTNAGRLWGSSVYACAVLLHVPPSLATGLQVTAAMVAVAFVYRAWRLPLVPDDRKLAVLLAASLLAAPHSSPYDMILLAVSGALWFASLATPRMGDAILLLLLWLAPLLAPPALVPAGRAEPLLVVWFLVVAAKRQASAGESRMPHAGLRPSPRPGLPVPL